MLNFMQIIDMHIKTTVRYYYMPSKWLKLERLTIPSVDENVE